MTTTSLSFQRSCSLFKCGIEARQGPHHVAQNSTTTTCPFKADSSSAPSVLIHVSADSAGAAAPARSTDRRELNAKTTASTIRMGTNRFMAFTPRVDTDRPPTLFLSSRLYCKLQEHGFSGRFSQVRRRDLTAESAEIVEEREVSVQTRDRD